MYVSQGASKLVLKLGKVLAVYVHMHGQLALAHMASIVSHAWHMLI